MSRSMRASVRVDMEGIIESSGPQPSWCGDPNQKSILFLLPNCDFSAVVNGDVSICYVTPKRVVTHKLRTDDKENVFKGWDFCKSSASLTD